MSQPLPLAQALDADRFGGKASQLAAMLGEGLPVPGGFALPFDLVEAIARGEGAALAALAGLELPWPMAVRSSGIGEDGVVASFAGQHLTCLNVNAPARLAEAVAAVWRSGHQAAALAYRARLGLEGAPRMGVVLQALVAPDVAGVLFTVNPVGGADERVIEASWGPGEAVVSGEVTPDWFRVARGGEVLERRIGFKDLAFELLPEGGTRKVEVADERAEAACLDDDYLRRLEALATRCEAGAEGPVDLEWAIAGGEVYLLQRRRVTGRSMAC